MRRLIWIGAVSLVVAVLLCGCATVPEFRNAPTTVDLSFVEKGLQLFDKYWPDFDKELENRYNQVKPITVYIAEKIQIAISWLSGAAWRQMNELAHSVSFASFKKHIDEHRIAGCNTVNLFLQNQKDGAPVPTSFYSNGKFSGNISDARLALIRQKIEYAYSQGFHVNFWMLADDGGIPYKDKAQIKRYFADCKTHLGDLIKRASYLVPCLEANECLGSRTYLDEYAKELKRLFPTCRIASHMTSGKYNWSVECPYVDVVFFQVDPDKSIAACKAELKRVVDTCSKPVLACEISLHGKSDEARQKAKDALDVGCIGVHSGVPKS